MKLSSGLAARRAAWLVRPGLVAGVILVLALSAAVDAVEIPVAGGTLTPISAPGAGYSNGSTDPWPMMVYLPSGYSATAAPYPLVFCLHGDGEVGNGSSDGTLVPSTTNQLCDLFTSGPMQLIASGSAYFGQQGVIVVQPQSDVGNGAGFNGTSGTVNRVDLTMQYVLRTYNVDHNRLYSMGLSCGAGALVRYAYASATNPDYTLCTVIPIANIQGIGSTYTAFGAFTKSITWFINDSDDTTAYLIDTTGRINAGVSSNTYGSGWAGGIALSLDHANSGGAVPPDGTKDRCLNTHPDVAAIIAGDFNSNGFIPATQLSNTCSGAYLSSAPAGWNWVANQVFSAGSTLQVTVRQGGGHSGWNQTFGSTTPNLPFWTWLLAQRLGQSPTAMVITPTVQVSPTSATLCGGQTETFSASALDSTGNPITPQPTITWSCASGTITASGRYTAAASHGSDTVTASATIASTLSQVSVPVTLVAPTLTLTPGGPALGALQPQQFAATAMNTVGAPLAVQPVVSWSCANGTISSTGLYTAPAKGSDVVTAAALSLGTAYSASASITVTAVTTGTGTATAAGTGSGGATGPGASTTTSAGSGSTGGGGCGLGGGPVGMVLMVALGLRWRMRARPGPRPAHRHDGRVTPS